MSTGKLTEMCWTRYSGRYSGLSSLNTIPAPSVGVTTFSVQMATSGFANQLQQHGLHIALSIATYFISSGSSVFGASVPRTNSEIMSLLTSNTPGGITTRIERSAMPTPTWLMRNYCGAMFTKDSKCFDIFPVSWTTFLSPTSCIQRRLACLTISRSGFSASWRRMNSSACTMQYGYLCLLTMTSPQLRSPMRKFLNGMGRSWGKCTGTCLELWLSLYKGEIPLSVPYSIIQLSAHRHC